ncbi:hypothetical protein ASE92_13185 [Pedobacter sp. Leaf41]|uniref:hypothetical protein n=1 Tax=Pedobacter sp. Leaf41 TaxID=1736218 RepID=UPI0007023DA6|nr:hypothetical protein [Pedobacter sp. Leaf41]KQN34543.1 hypothetical protein ASE92_13185 [Pedobacter sp. Leaf41]
MKYIYMIIIVFYSISLFAQINISKQYVIVDIDSTAGKYSGCNAIIASDNSGREIYALNVRFKLNQIKRSRINDNADFMFTFYIIPQKKIVLKEVLSTDALKKITINMDEIKEKLLSSGYYDFFDFQPIIKSKDKYYTFEKCKIVGQAFDLQEDLKYFPEYGGKSYKFKLNLLSKPYTKENIDSLRRVIMKDSTALKPFDTWIDDFYDKWFISNIDDKNKTVDFWIDLKPIHDAEYSFGRITTEIKYKIGLGITDFKIIPHYSISEVFFKDDFYPVPFHYKKSFNLQTLLND